MRLVEYLSRLKGMGQTVLRTADVMALFDIEKDHATKILSRLSSSGHMFRIKRGLWVIEQKTDPMILAEYLTAPFPCYISLQTALCHHGMISQIPDVIYCVSIARTCSYNTPVGTFSVHHVAGDFFFGYEETGIDGVKMASPEKALLDFLYLSSTRSRLFAALPELELPQGFSVRRARKIILDVGSSSRRSMLQKRFEDVLSVAKTSTLSRYT